MALRWKNRKLLAKLGILIGIGLNDVIRAFFIL